MTLAISTAAAPLGVDFVDAEWSVAWLTEDVTVESDDATDTCLISEDGSGATCAEPDRVIDFDCKHDEAACEANVTCD